MNDRRQFLAAGLAGLSSAWWVPTAAADDDPSTLTHSKPITRERVRVGFVGIGVKGWQHYRNLLHTPGVEMVAVCDILEGPVQKAQAACRTLGRPIPTGYTRGQTDFERMCGEENLDLVYTATPWEWHVPVCLAAMNAGQHAATEIPAAITEEDCWRLVDTSESTGRHLSMMENVNYRRDELAVLKMVRDGALGELIHAEAGYLHDTRYLKARDYGDGLWLGAHHAARSGNLYPTHGLGPLAWNFNLGRGNRMEYLVSMSSKARGMNLYAREHLPEGHPYRERDYINGDVNSSLIQTAGGESILIKHDTDLPRPYSRVNLVQGTRGIVRGFPRFLVSLETPASSGRVDGADYRPHHQSPRWDAVGDEVYERFDHPLWRSMQRYVAAIPKTDAAATAGGFDLASEVRQGDYTEDYRLVQALRRDIAPDYDVYDAADWSVVTALSERSVANRSQAVDFPDFTRGKWKDRTPIDLGNG